MRKRNRNAPRDIVLPVAVDGSRYDHPVCPDYGPPPIAVDADTCEHPVCPDVGPEPVAVDGSKYPHPFCF